MATYSTEIDSPRDREEAFDYLATFSNAREWDPSVTEAEALSLGSAKVGSCTDSACGSRAGWCLSTTRWSPWNGPPAWCSGRGIL